MQAWWIQNRSTSKLKQTQTVWMCHMVVHYRHWCHNVGSDSDRSQWRCGMNFTYEHVCRTEWPNGRYILKCTSEKWAGVRRNYRGETSETAKNIAQWVLVVATAQNATTQNSLPSTYIPTFSSHGICVGTREKNPSVRFLLEKQNEYMETAITIQFYSIIIHSIHVAICIHSFDQSRCLQQRKIENTWDTGHFCMRAHNIGWWMALWLVNYRGCLVDI